MTDREKRIVAAAMAWAEAERSMRNQNENRDNPWATQPSWEERHRVSLTADWTEQALLDACEAKP